MPNIKKMHETDKDQQHEEFISGRHQEIPVDPAKEFHRTTLAAGAVIWRGSPQEPEIALIHRPHYDDWSLPKGKVDPGEALQATAVREIAEETGYSVRLGRHLRDVSYDLDHARKHVRYWSARAVGGDLDGVLERAGAADLVGHVVGVGHHGHDAVDRRGQREAVFDLHGFLLDRLRPR